MRRAIVELEKQTRDFEHQISAKQAGIERAAGEDAGLVGAEAEMIARLSQFQERREVLETTSQNTRATRQASLLQLEESGAELRKGRVQLHEAEEELHRVEVRIAQTETEMQQIELRFIEEFDLPLEEALTHKGAIEQKQLALDEIEVLKDKISRLGQRQHRRD